MLQDINRLACSIELYFGVDVLTVDGALVPIQWKGYDERLQKYRGEVMRKDLLKLTHGQRALLAFHWPVIRDVITFLYITPYLPDKQTNYLHFKEADAK